MKNKTRESELPDLEGPEGNQALIADNIRALQPVYFELRTALWTTSLGRGKP